VNAGHGGGKPLAKRLEETADAISFTLWNMGVKK
jgi:prolyl oligopeptidase